MTFTRRRVRPVARRARECAPGDGAAVLAGDGRRGRRRRRPAGAAAAAHPEQQVEVLAVDRLALEQRLRDAVEQVAVLRQDRPRLVVGLVQEALDLVVHHLGGALGHLAALRHLPAEEDLLLPVAHRHHADPLAHAELRHHAPGDAGGPLDVVAGAGGDLLRAEHQLLGHPAAEEDRQPADQPVLGVAVAVLLGQRRQ